MTGKEQEQLFTELRASHPEWAPKFCSGYVHGAVDELLRDKPKGTYIIDAGKKEQYALGYLVGFAVRRGTDCELEPWFSVIGDMMKGLK
jgi:hypothetical protein